MREKEALERLQIHRERCAAGCPRPSRKNADLGDLCDEGFQLVLQLIESDDDA